VERWAVLGVIQAALADDYGLRVGKMRVLSASRPSTFTAAVPFAFNLVNCAHGEV